jgi:hypothetical protein
LNIDICTHILMFVVGLVLLIGSAKYVILSFTAQRGVLPAIAFGAFGFLVGTALCVWAVVGTPD